MESKESFTPLAEKGKGRKPISAVFFQLGKWIRRYNAAEEVTGAQLRAVEGWAQLAQVLKVLFLFSACLQ
jgi:hypothetical protein